MRESGFTFWLGTATIAFVKMADIKDATAILVGVVTVVCMIYSTFFKKKKDKTE
jgi:hypothetical protein